MKIKRKQASYQEVLAMPKAKHFKPGKPSFLFSTIVRILAIGELRRTRFTYTTERAEVLKQGPCLILMNHSSFIDLQMASKILYPRRYNIVCTSDGFVGKKLLMRLLGCIPTKKFVTDLTLYAP
jgi:1-acyl-sn-glycerol-3-phosphate acyltransferase